MTEDVSNLADFLDTSFSDLDISSDNKLSKSLLQKLQLLKSAYPNGKMILGPNVSLMDLTGSPTGFVFQINGQEPIKADIFPQKGICDGISVLKISGLSFTDGTKINEFAFFQNQTEIREILKNTLQETSPDRVTFANKANDLLVDQKDWTPILGSGSVGIYRELNKQSGAIPNLWLCVSSNLPELSEEIYMDIEKVSRTKTKEKAKWNDYFGSKADKFLWGNNIAKRNRLRTLTLVARALGIDTSKIETRDVYALPNSKYQKTVIPSFDCNYNRIDKKDNDIVFYSNMINTRNNTGIVCNAGVFNGIVIYLGPKLSTKWVGNDLVHDMFPLTYGTSYKKPNFTETEKDMLTQKILFWDGSKEHPSVHNTKYEKRKKIVEPHLGYKKEWGTISLKPWIVNLGSES